MLPDRAPAPDDDARPHAARRLRRSRRAGRVAPRGRRWPSADLRLTVLQMASDDGRTRRLVLIGELDLATAPRLRRAVLACSGPGIEGLQIDLARLSFVDLVGYRLLRDLPALAAEHATRLRYVRTPAPVARLGELLADRAPWPPEQQ